jgi:2-polyprenyl-6-methoxyphenol hydroxylase-like FAD-dependent oxidoreductase
MKLKYDVVVVGAGPAGLWTASELRLAGLDVAVLEQRETPTHLSRALTIHGRTIELLAMRGIADRFLAEGRPIPTGHYAALDTPLDFSGFDTRYPFTLFLPQSRTEALLEGHARDLGVDVRRGYRVEEVSGDKENGYCLTTRHATGDDVFAARAVVGADARRSIVRESAGIAFEGYPSTRSIMMGDVRMARLEGPPVQRVSNARGGVMIVPVGPDGLIRVIVVDPAHLTVPLSEPLTLRELSAAANAILETDLGMHDPAWLTRFGDETRLAARYRQGNILVVGDAAHVHAPMGGQGMNVGMQDAMNLGWKLAAVLKGEAPDLLLDSYDAERRPVGQQLARNTEGQVALATGFDPAHLALRAEMSDLLTHSDVNRRLAGTLSGFDLRYAPGPLLGGDERVADVELVLEDGRATRLHDLLTDGRWLHLSLGQPARTELPAWLAPSGVRSETARPADGEEKRRPKPATFLVRPDGYSFVADDCLR